MLGMLAGSCNCSAVASKFYCQYQSCNGYLCNIVNFLLDFQTMLADASELVLDPVDREILRLLQKDGRMSNVQLAEQVNLSPPACLRRVQRLEASGVIAGYVMLVDPRRVGKKTSLFVEITLQSQSEEAVSAFEKAVIGCPGVMECYFMAGDVDYLLRVLVNDPEDYEFLYRRHLSRLPGVARIKSNLALRSVSRRTEVEV